MPSSAITPPPSSASKAKVVRGLLEGLLAGRWGDSDRFTEAFGVETFGVSRTPVREALLELQALGFVELRRNCGAIVLPFGENELRELYAVRSLLEVEATRLATASIPTHELESLVVVFQELKNRNGNDPDWRHDRDLHQCISTHCGNRRLASEIDRYSNLIQAIREIVGKVMQGIHATSADEHLAILHAIEAKDPKAAGQAMQAHLQQASDSAIEAMRSLRKKS